MKLNGNSAFRDATGTQYKGELVPYGETILFRHAWSKSGRKKASKKQMKGDARWDFGIFLGKDTESDEWLVGTRDLGVVTARTVRRVADTSVHDRELMLKFTGVPWNRSLGSTGVFRPAPDDVPRQPESAEIATPVEEQEARDLANAKAQSTYGALRPETMSKPIATSAPLTVDASLEYGRSSPGAASSGIQRDGGAGASARREPLSPSCAEATLGAQGELDTSNMDIVAARKLFRGREAGEQTVAEPDPASTAKKPRMADDVTMDGDVGAIGERMDGRRRRRERVVAAPGHSGPVPHREVRRGPRV